MKLIPLKGKGNENLYRHPDTGIIYFKKFRAGKGRIEKSTKTKVLSDAKIIADQFRIKFFGEGVIRRGKRTCGELFHEWIGMNQSKSSATQESIKFSWKHLQPYIQDFLPEEVTEKFWESVYIPEKRLTHGEKRRFFNDRKWLSMFLHWLKREGIIDNVPKLRNPDPEAKAGKEYTDEEIKKLLENARPDLHLQIKMALTMAMRKTEIMKMEWSRIDMNEQVMHLFAEHTKIRKARSFAISEPVMDILKFRKKVGPFLFPSAGDPTKVQNYGVNESWQRLKRRVGVKGRFHDLRHTFLTRAFRSPDVNPALVCFYAGLSLEEAQEKYLHFKIQDTHRVAQALRESWGKNV